MLLRVVAKAGQHDTRATNFVAARIGESVGACIVVGGRLFGGSGSSVGEIGSIGTDLGTAIASLVVLLDSGRITNRRGAHEPRAGAVRCCYSHGTPTSAAVPGSTRRYPIQRTRCPRHADRHGRSGLPLAVRNAMRDQHLVCSRASKRGSKRGPSARNPSWGRQERSGRTCGNL